MWRRSESDSVHSQRRFHASAREICDDMAVTLAKCSPPQVPSENTGGSGSTIRRASRSPASLAATPMEKFVIEGGVPLSGTITAAGNKNGALPIIAACLLTTDEVILRNVPRISDVEAMTLLLEDLGARVQWLGPGEVSIQCADITGQTPDRGLSRRILASVMLARPPLARLCSL